MYLVSISVAVTHIAYYEELTRKQYMKEQFWFHTFFFQEKTFYGEMNAIFVYMLGYNLYATWNSI